jgi:hypothetical protein
MEGAMTKLIVTVLFLVVTAAAVLEVKLAANHDDERPASEGVVEAR